MSDVSSPKASRQKRPRWLDPKLIAGILFVAVSMALGAQVIARADQTIEVWAVTEDVEVGLPVADALVAKRVYFASTSDAERYLTASERLPRKARATRALGAGELLPKAAVATGEDRSTLDLPVPVTDDLAPNGLSQGDIIDVYVVPDEAGGGEVDETTKVLDQVRVVNPGGGEGFGGATGTQRITVRVRLDDEFTEEEVASAASAISEGTPYVVRRPNG